MLIRGLLLCALFLCVCKKSGEERRGHQVLKSCKQNKLAPHICDRQTQRTLVNRALAARQQRLRATQANILSLADQILCASCCAHGSVRLAWRAVSLIVKVKLKHLKLGAQGGAWHVRAGQRRS